MIFEKFEYTVGLWWVDPIEYGDYDDLNASEQRMLESFLTHLPPGGHWSWGENCEAQDELSRCWGNCVKATYLVPMDQQ